MQANIAQIQRYSVGDGPGIRTTVFFKGCNLRCPWCHNPETIAARPVLMFHEQLCRLCGQCAAVCDMHTLGDGTHLFDRAKCTGCGRCAEMCPGEALSLCGGQHGIDELMRTLLEDRDFYVASDGGITLSGGEPLLQADACAGLAGLCRAEGLHVLLDTAGNVEWAAFEKVLSRVDMCYFDLKSGSQAGYDAVGGSLTRTLENLRRTAELVETVVRIPVIPGFNDSCDEARQMAGLLKQTSVCRVELLPFHRLGSGKYDALGKPYAYAERESMTPTALGPLLEIFGSKGFDARVGG